jgi:hypothetical protein
MGMILRMKQALNSQTWIKLAFAVAFSLSTHFAGAQAVNISSFTIGGGGERQLQFSSEATNYYVLYAGNSVTGVTHAIQVVLGALPTTAMQDTNAQGAASFYRVRTVDTNAPLDLDDDGTDDVAELLAGTDPLYAPARLVINEVDYDQPGTDNMEYVEILNVASYAVSLNGLKLVLVNGANNTDYRSVDLSAAGSSLAAGQYLVVKATAVTVGAGVLTIDFASATDNVQNGAPDGIAIFDSNSNQIIDALSYEGSITAATITGAPGTYNLVEGTPLPVGVADSNAAAGSLCRLPNGTDTDDADSDWALSTTLTPGAANVP